MPVPASDEAAAGARTVETGGTKIHTIGHSTRDFATFAGLLDAFGIESLVDVRTIPRSRRMPHFSQEALAAALLERGICYAHVPRLGGLRKPRADSINTGWKNPSFRGYADYMQTPEFEHGVAELMEIARGRRTVIMCAEAVPWKCHRSLVADALSARGVHVVHIMSPTSSQHHELTGFARVSGTTVTYPGLI